MPCGGPYLPQELPLGAQVEEEGAVGAALAVGGALRQQLELAPLQVGVALLRL